jgi:hypothetical protein
MRFILFALILVSMNASAQSTEDQIKKTINNLFEGMRTSDTALLRSAFSPTAVLQTVLKNKEGKVVVRNEQVDKFIESVGKPHEQIYDERITFDLIRIDDDLAIAWTPYKFYIGEKFSHCGVNSFQLVRLNEGWKIQYLIDTRRKEGCK